MKQLRTVLVLLFDDVEVLDFAGPFEVFHVAESADGRRLFNVHTVAGRSRIRTRGGLSVNPDFSLDESPAGEILVVPGGRGTRREMNNKGLVSWIGDRAAQAEMVLSVCTGSLLLAKAGLLRGQTATTHHSALEELRAAAPETRVIDGCRYVDNGRIVTSAGISAGIDMSLHALARLWGNETAIRAAAQMEYDWTPAD